jgi:hypothetical protein
MDDGTRPRSASVRRIKPAGKSPVPSRGEILTVTGDARGHTMQFYI